MTTPTTKIFLAQPRCTPYTGYAVRTTASGGTWAAGIYNFRVVAWQTAAETDGSYAGLANWAFGPLTLNVADAEMYASTASEMDGIKVVADDLVTLKVNKPSQAYNHLSAYRQSTYGSCAIYDVNTGDDTFRVSGDNRKYIYDGMEATLLSTHDGVHNVTISGATYDGTYTTFTTSAGEVKSDDVSAYLYQWDSSKQALKLTAVETDNGDGTVSLAIADDGVADVETTLTVWSANSTTKTITLAGDKRINFSDDTFPVSLPSDDSVFVDAPAVLDTDGVNTEVVLANCENWDYEVTFHLGYPLFYPSTRGLDADHDPTIQPILDRVDEPHINVGKGYNGTFYKRYNQNDCSLERIRIIYLGNSVTPQLQNQLVKWHKNGHRCLLVDYYDTVKPYVRGWYGYIESLDYLMLQGKRSRDTFEFVFAVESEWDIDDA